MIWILIGFQVHTCNIRQICSPWFLVYRALVHPGISASGRVNSVDMNDWHSCEENLLSGFHKFAASAIPPGSVKIQSMHIEPFSWGLSDVIFKETRDVIMKHHAVQGPALVRTRHFLKNRKENRLSRKLLKVKQVIYKRVPKRVKISAKKNYKISTLRG